MDPRLKTASAQAKSFPSEVSAYLAKLDADKRAQLEALFHTTLLHSQKPEISDLWENGDLSVSFWILVTTGVNQEEEMAIATSLLFWKAFFAQSSALVRCIQTSDHREFACCCSRFGNLSCPTLLIGDSPTMDSYLKVGPELLFALSKKRGSLERWFSKLHHYIENGTPLQDVQRKFNTQQFWSALNCVFAELQSAISMNSGDSTHEPIVAFHHHDYSMKIQGGIHGSNVAIGGSTVSNSTATYNSIDELVGAIEALRSILDQLPCRDRNIADRAIQILLASAKGEKITTEKLVEAAQTLVRSSPTMQDRVKDIAGRIGLSLTSSAIFQAIKFALGMS